MAKSSYLKDESSTVQAFTDALKRAQDFVQNESAADVAKIIQPYFENVDIEIIETVIERYKAQGSYATDPILDEGEWDNLQTIMEEAGELPQRVEYGKLVNTTFAKKAAE
ncbi:hypothetical protein D9M71_477950 [compost metagenome]